MGRGGEIKKIVMAVGLVLGTLWVVGAGVKALAHLFW